MPIPGSGLFQSSSRPTAFHKCGTATDFKRSSAELERGAPQPAFLGARNGFRRAMHRSRQLKLEMIYQLRISAVYSSDSSNRSQLRTYVGSRAARYRAQGDPRIAFSRMETAILLGIPIPYVARLRNAQDSHGGLPEAWILFWGWSQ